MTIYLDESGCTGFKFDLPYLFGGSSRFLVLGYTIVPDIENTKLLRLTRKIFQNNKVNFKERELKGHSLKRSKATQACRVIKKYVSNSGIEVDILLLKKLMRPIPSRSGIT